VFDIILFYLSSYSDTVRGNGIDQASHNLTVATRNTFGDLDQSVRPVAPLQFLQVRSPSLSYYN
jgi:ubiquitin carboxyl-terminal hydrolase 14